MPRAVSTGKRVKDGTCPTCSGPVLIGSWYGLPVVIDPEELTPLTELDAVLAQRRTYSWHPLADDVYPRSAWKIRVQPAGTRTLQTEHAQHHCPPSEGTPTRERTPHP